MTVDYKASEMLPLTAMERSALTHAEATIEQGLTSFVEVGEALAKVRDEQLYRDEFGTFKAYCRERWNLGESRVYQLMDAAAVTSTIVEPELRPANEGQARALSGLGPETAADVMRKAHDATDGKPTAAAIKAARTPEAPESADLGQGEAGSSRTPQGETASDSERTAAAPAQQLDDFLAGDQSVQDSRYMKEFLTAAKVAQSLGGFDVDRLAQIADQHDAMVIDNLASSIAAFHGRFTARRGGLRLVKGGTQ